MIFAFCRLAGGIHGHRLDIHARAVPEHQSRAHATLRCDDVRVEVWELNGRLLLGKEKNI